MAISGENADKQVSSSSLTSNSCDKDLNLYCQPCNWGGHRVAAHCFCINCSEHLCETCSTVHRRQKISRNHTLLDKANMPHSMSSETQVQSDNFIKPCPKHNMEMIKFYCNNHRDLLCGICATLEHRTTSCEVSYIPDISSKIIDSKEYQETLKKISDLTLKSSKTLHYMKKMNDKSNKSLTDALTNLKIFRTKINKRLDELERQIMETANAIQKDNVKILRQTESLCDDVSKFMTLSSDAIKLFNSTKDANNLFIEVKHAEQTIKNNNQKLNKLLENEVKRYNFEPNQAISNQLNKEKAIGTLAGNAYKLKYRQCSNTCKISIKASEDKHHCLVTGMTLVKPGMLIIADMNNKAIKLVDVSIKSLITQQCFDSNPLDVTSVSQREIAVTFPSDQVIQFLSVAKDNLQKAKTLKVNGECSGIIYHNNRIVVTFLRPHKVEILQMNGAVVKTIKDENIFKFPEYVTANGNFIYVSDSLTKTVIKLDWQSKLKGIYSCTAKPFGLTMSKEETVFVCYQQNDVIQEMVGDFTEEEEVVQEIQNPQTVYWSADTCTLYTSSIGCSEEGNFIKSFNLL